ncbi:unnamed protein product [Owenia fusiformis]|uniref:Uncharacterized protein n=1 Tax=Owenia fusiformis TaxID=6347 RepID=A0A8S4PXT2_OWEFU|nr:unnamed protein product [Owenia fusiformis]
MASIWYLSGLALIVAFMGSCVDADSNIMEVEWKGQNIQIFNRSTAFFVESQDCLPGFYKGLWQNESCYMFVMSPMTRTEASTFCTEVALGNGLVAVETELDHMSIVAKITNTIRR